MTMRTSIHGGGLLVSAALVAACGGSGGPGLGDGGTTAGIDGTGAPVVAVGTVTSFGSVIVNGVRYDTSNTSFTIDGEFGSQDDLSVGDVVRVVGSLDDSDSSLGTADSIVFDDLVEGPIEIGSINRVAGILVVLGQTVRVTADTSFDNSVPTGSLDGLTAGDVVEVTGLVASDGSITATRVELKPAGGLFEVTGLVANHSAGSFQINGLVVDYSRAMLDDFPSGMIEDGQLVEVKGMDLAARELDAMQVQFKGNEINPGTDDQIEIEGFVTRFVDATDFDVAGFPVTINSSTQFEGGATGDLRLDIKVEVEGGLNAVGVLLASKVDIRRSSSARLAARVDSVDTSTNSFVALGITVGIDRLTRLEDKFMDVEPFTLAQLAAGDYAEVRGAETGSSELIASLVERDDPDTQTELRGRVESIARPAFTILGVTVTTHAGTSLRDADRNLIDADTFFAELREGDLVNVDGVEVADRAIQADEAELE